MRQRIQWLDFGKGFFIFWVVVAHVLKSIYSRPIYSTQINNVLQFFGDITFFFIMPAFFALSGFLFRKRDTCEEYLKFIWKKAINLFVPYIVFSIIYVILQHFGSNINHHYTFGSLLSIWCQPISYLWFLYVLFFIFVLVGLMSLLRIAYTVQLLLCALVFACVCIFQLKLMIFQTFGNAIFFLIGTLTYKNIDSVVSKKKNFIFLVFYPLHTQLYYNHTVHGHPS